MAYYQGKDVRLVLTTEADLTYIYTSGAEILTATASGTFSSYANRWILSLPTNSATTSSDYTESGYASPYRLTNIETIEVDHKPEREDIEIIGRMKVEHPKMRQTFKVTIHRVVDGPYFARLYDVGDNGVQESASATNSWRPSTDLRGITDGFRIFMYLTNQTASPGTYSVYTFRNATVESHTLTPTPNKFTRETIVLSGNLWTMSNAPNVAPTVVAEL